MNPPSFGAKLFLSCDLVGSTRYKQTRTSGLDGSDDDQWMAAFTMFYEQFPLIVADKCKDAVTPTLWKAIGDELIFTVDIDREAQVASAVEAWIQALDEMALMLFDKKHPLKTKGGAFTANFPTPDRELHVGLNGGSSTLVDFIGPSMDTGFRVLGACSERYFTMSVEVAWAYCAHLEQASIARSDFHWLGLHEMKGVWDGRPYPVFAIDRQSKDPVVAALRKVTGDTLIEPQAVIAVARACHDSDWPSRIYLAKGSVEFKSEDLLSKMRSVLEARASMSDSVPEALPGDSPMHLSARQTQEAQSPTD